MEDIEPTRASTSLPHDSDTVPLSIAADEAEEAPKQEDMQDMEGIDTMASSFHLVKETYILQDGLPVDVVLFASLPTNSGYFTDCFLADAASKPYANIQLKELCLSAQNVRTKNEVSRQPTQDHWDYLLEEASAFSMDMRQQRKNFVQIAKDAADAANFGYTQRWNRRRGSIKAWELYRRPVALAQGWTPEVIEGDATEHARRASNQYIKRNKSRAAAISERGLP